MSSLERKLMKRLMAVGILVGLWAGSALGQSCYSQEYYADPGDYGYQSQGQTIVPQAAAPIIVQPNAPAPVYVQPQAPRIIVRPTPAPDVRFAPTPAPQILYDSGPCGASYGSYGAYPGTYASPCYPGVTRAYGVSGGYSSSPFVAGSSVYAPGYGFSGRGTPYDVSIGQAGIQVRARRSLLQSILGAY